MPPNPDHDDGAFMWSMHKALGELAEITRAKTEADIHSELLLQRGVERCIEIVGEMANNVTKETRDLHPQINWKGIINQRHVIAHNYGSIRHDLLWLIVTKHAPTLREQLEAILPEPPEDPLPEEPTP